MMLFLTSSLFHTTQSTALWKEHTPSSESFSHSKLWGKVQYYPDAKLPLLKTGKVTVAACVLVADVTFLPNEANAIESLNI